MKTAWIFDVDGVITNLATHKANLKILEFISKLLKKNEPVALNTGRWLEWIKTNVISDLKSKFAVKKELENLYVVGEKGTTWLTFEENNEKQEIDRKISIPKKLREKIRELIEKNYPSMVSNPSKTMAAIERKKNLNLKTYKKQQAILLPYIVAMVKKMNLEKKLSVIPGPIAIDINNKNVGKDLGIKRILNILNKRKIKVDKFITFGDLDADLKMAEELHNQGFSVTHVHVGKENINSNKKFQIKITKNKFEKGTLEFLKSL